MKSKCKIGIDMVSEQRMALIWDKYKIKLLDKICSDLEKESVLRLISKNQNRAGRFISSIFAAKESVSKCLKISPFKIGFKNIRISRNKGRFNGVAVKLDRVKTVNCDISVTHSMGNCIAVCIVY